MSTLSPYTIYETPNINLRCIINEYVLRFCELFEIFVLTRVNRLGCYWLTEPSNLSLVGEIIEIE